MKIQYIGEEPTRVRIDWVKIEIWVWETFELDEKQAENLIKWPYRAFFRTTEDWEIARKEDKKKKTKEDKKKENESKIEETEEAEETTESEITTETESEETETTEEVI